MRALLTWLLCMGILLSGGMGSVAHAMEPAAGVPVAATALGHIAGDDDEVPADADKAYPHHHAGCHDHQFGMFASESRAAACALPSDLLAELPQSPLREAAPEAQRRPPRA